MARISVVGAGYVGSVTGACLAELGHAVTCVDLDTERLSHLTRGSTPLCEQGLEALIGDPVAAGRLRFTANYPEASPDCEFAFTAVNTPATASGEADPTAAHTALRSILTFAPTGLTVVVKSTVPVGTGDQLAGETRSSGRGDIRIVSNPEFLREGSAVRDFRCPDRIVIGAHSPDAGAAVAALYQGPSAPVIRCSHRSAELAKYTANAFLATRVFLMNEIAAVCEAAGADIEEVARISGADPRIGAAYLRAGLGWGGSCLPKDVRPLIANADRLGCRAPILDAVFAVNVRRRERAFHTLTAAVDSRDDACVGVLGLAFKPGTDDIPEAPALDIIERLLRAGIRVRAHDPVAMPAVRRVLPVVALGCDAYDTAHGCDALLLASEWPEYLALDWRQMRTTMRGRFVLDGRNALDVEALAGPGLEYASVGRPPRTV